MPTTVMTVSISNITLDDFPFSVSCISSKSSSSSIPFKSKPNSSNSTSWLVLISGPGEDGGVLVKMEASDMEE